MPALSPRTLPDFADIPVERDRWALFADVDGTLLPFAPHPDAARPAPGLIDTLQAVAAALDGALALVSGRPIDDLDRLLRGLRVALAGGHGLERRRADGWRSERPSVPDGLSVLHRAFDRFHLAHPETIVENKRYAVALHYRQAPHLADAVAAVAEHALSRAGDDIALMRGNMVIEAKGNSADKGAAVRAFMAEAPFRGRTPVFVGDDVTDEDGFAAVNDMGGYAVIVGDREPTAARYRLATVEAVHDWLTAIGRRAAA